MNQDYFQNLLEYKNTFGNTNVPRSYITENGLKLGDWVHRLRLRKKGTKGSKLTEEEIAELDAIGFVWNLGTRPDASVFEGANIAEDVS